MAAAEKLWGLLFFHPKVVEEVLSMSRLPKHARRTKSCRFLTCFVHPVDLIFFQLLVTWSCPSAITCSLQQRQAGAWQPVTADNVPAARHGHTAVLDAKQRMWVFGGSSGALEVKAARCGAHISMGYRVSEHPNRGYSFYLDIPYIYIP